MTEQGPLTLYLVVCGAGPAAHAGRLVDLALDDGWQVKVIATPSGLEFIDRTALESQTGSPVRTSYRSPGEPRGTGSPPDAIVVAPATFNTINKLAVGIADNYALGFLAEHVGTPVPVIVLPFINTVLASRQPLRWAVKALREEGVLVLLGGGGFEPHPPRTGGEHFASYPWDAAIAAARAGLPKWRGG